jgi:hypothetical protein
MKTTKKSIIRKNALCLIIVLSVLFSGCVYMKMDPPADVDKSGASNDNSCYAAAASNMLAGAGYGNGATLQARAEDIYADMIAHFGIANGGWMDTALNWWLGSSHNTWSSNPYQLVTVYGYKSVTPWDPLDGPMFIGNNLRDCNFVGLSISPVGGGMGHAFTCWGDDGNPLSQLTSNPSSIRATDSDDDTGGDVQVYNYDDYNNPNPGGSNVGNGWYIDYNPTPDHRLIKHITVLSPIDIPGQHVQRVVGSYKIHQDQDEEATDLHYKVGTDTDILTYRTWVNWIADNPPDITETGIMWEQLEVLWEFYDNPIPHCEMIIIWTEFILPYWNTIKYSDVYFTYNGDAGRYFPSLNWKISTPEISNPGSIPDSDATGGYVIGSFDLVDPERDEVVGEYRLIHQYNYFQDPEKHQFLLSTDEPGYNVKNIRFGHSYGYLDSEGLWEFGEQQEWMTYIAGEYELEDEPLNFLINWEGRLPYPPGDL